MRNWKQSSISVSNGDILPASILAISLPEILDCASAYNTGILIEDNESLETSFYSYKNLLTDAACILGGLRSFGLQPQDKVILQLQDKRAFFAALWGCFLGGFVPIPLEVEINSVKGNNKLDKAWGLCDSPLVIAETPLEKFKTATITDLLDNQPDRNYHYSNLDELALLLFTSGSTGKPKGVMLSVQNILASIYGMAKINQLTKEDITLNWMPLEHVASLVMFHLTEVYLGCQQIHVSTGLILQNTLIWLDLIYKYRVTATWSPNFAYNLVNQKLKDSPLQQWDLSCVRWMGNGAEAVVAQTTKKFLQLLAPYGLNSNAVSPGYGMSETCSGIAHSDSFDLNTESDFVEVGAPIPGVSLRIVNENNEVIPEGEIGLLQVKGETVTTGYYQQPELNQEVFTNDGWFNTGDLGFLKQGKLTITGRQKDVIIINGVNYYNHDIERVVEEIPSVTVSFTAACGVRNQSQEQIAIFFHTEEKEEKLRELIKEIRSRVFKEIGVAPTYIIPVTKDTIPKTAIGKIQRQQLSKRFAAGEFNNSIAEIKQLIETRNLNLLELPQNEIEKHIVAVWQEVLNLTTVGIKDNFFELGGNSLLLMEVLGKLTPEYSLSAVTLFQYPTIAALANHLQNDTQSSAIEAGIKRGKRRQAYQDVAIIGMSCRFPGAANVSQFWENLCNGVESITWFSDRECLDAGVDAELLSNRNYVKASPILDNIEGFDAEFWGYSPKEAQLLDPQQRLFLECAWECLEDAGYDPFTYQGEIGLYGGAAANTYLLNHIYPHRDEIDKSDRLNTLNLSSLGGFQLTVANDKDYITTRTSYKLNLTGSSVNVQTACSTSLVTVHLACQSLINSECDMALAGGVSVHTPQKMGYLYQEGMILSPDGHCKAFDADAGGTVFGSGAGMVVLKLLDRAIEEGDRIYGIIKGSAVNNDGGTKVGYLAPNVEGQARVVAEALTVADIPPHTIGYIEAHGTGTKLGDPIEIAALTQAFQGVESQKITANSCAVGSVKTNVGHLQIASGIVGLIKATLCLYHRQIPPSLHFQKPNPQIDFNSSPFYINTQLQTWQSNGYPRRSGVNSLGIGGTNAHLIIEEFDEVRGQRAVGREQPFARTGGQREYNSKEIPAYLFTISAKNEKALQDLAVSYKKYLNKHPYLELKDVCFTVNKGRHHFNYRRAIVTKNKADLIKKLEESFTALPIVENNKIAFLFTGQGSQYIGMAQQLYSIEAVFRENIDRCAEILKTEEDIRILDAFYNTSTANFDINQTQYTQPLLFAIEYSLAQMWLSWNVKPDVVIGHSLGEYVAATIAGVFSLEDALKLVTNRAKLMQKLPQNGAMLAVFTNKENVDKFLSKDVVIAADNGSHIVLSGLHGDVINIVKELDYLGIKHQCLKVTHGFHSPLMKPIIKEFKAVADTVNYSLPTIPLVSNLTGQLADKSIATSDYWIDHVLQPVEFAKSIEFLKQQSVNIFLEIGTKQTLTTIAESILKNKLFLHSLNKNTSDWQQIVDTLAKLYTKGIDINWKQVTQCYKGAIVSLPTYSFQRKKYWFELPKNTDSKQVSKIENKIHPLLEHKITTPLKQTIYQSFLNRNTIPWLKDHRINNKIIFPGTAYLEIAIASAIDSLKTKSLTVSNVSFNKPFVINDINAIPEVQLILTPEDKSQKWEFYSLDNEEWQLHSYGKILPLVETASNINLEELQQQFKELEYDIKLHYKKCTDKNINYGKTFQGIKQLYGKNNEALGFIKLPDNINISQYYFYPALLDACLQILFVALPQELQTLTYIPISLEKLEIYRLPNNKVWSHLKIREEKKHKNIIADVLLYNDSGEPIAKITGLESQSISNKPTWHNWLYKQQWQQQSLSLKPAVNNKTGTWLIFADTTGIAEDLIAILNNKKEKYSIVNHDTISKNNFNTWQSLIQQQKNIKGIIYLGSLEKATANESCENYLYLLQSLINSQIPNNPHIWFVTRNAQAIENYQLTSGINQSCLWGMDKAIALEHPELSSIGIDLAPYPTAKDAANIWQEICSLETEKVAYRHNKRYVARLIRTTLELPTANQQLQITNPGNLDSLQWQNKTRLQPKENEIEIEVKATGLNFRDVMIALDLYPDDSLFLGLECAGVVTRIGNKVTDFKIGDPVIAIAPNSFSQYLTVNSLLATPQPDCLTFTEAATIPVTFLTAYYTLIHLGKLQPQEKVLIHAAAGGVGLAAIAIAKQIGAEIFATASPSKWELLRSWGVTNIMNSRSLDFAEEIMTLTKGKGVDVVLNSLSDEFIAKSISVLKDGGRFLEIGKQDIWNKEDAAKVKPNINYFIIDLWRITQDNPQLIQEMLNQLIPQFATGKLKPLPQTLFINEKVCDAFRYMQQGKHTGKIVITQSANKSNITNPVTFNGTYLITGGMGAIGLKVAQWLSKKGVKHLVLIGRNKIKPELQPTLEKLTEDIQVKTIKADVADPNQVANVFHQIESNLPPLKGIIHCAGVTSDRLIEHQDVESFDRVLAPKVQGGWNLHHLSSKYDIESFILFSSASSLIGAAGQANYCAANTYLDTLAQARRTQGLPAISINWGAWQNTGLVNSQVEHNLKTKGISVIPPDEAIEILEQIIASNPPQIGVIPIDWQQWKLKNKATSFYNELISLNTPETTNNLLQQLTNSKVEQRLSIITQQLTREVANILGIKDIDDIDLDAGFSELGLDSLSSVELRNKIQSSYNLKLETTLIFDYPTIKQLGNYLLSLLFISEVKEETVSINQTDNKLTEIAELSEAEAEELLLKELENFDNI